MVPVPDCENAGREWGWGSAEALIFCSFYAQHNMESYVMEINMCKNDAVFNINNLRSWMQPQQVIESVVKTINSSDRIFM